MKKLLVCLLVLGVPIAAVCAMGGNATEPGTSPTGINYVLMSQIVSNAVSEESKQDPTIDGASVGGPNEAGVINLNLNAPDYAQGKTYFLINDIVQSLVKAGQDPTKVDFSFCVFAQLDNVTTMTGKPAVAEIGHNCYDPYTDSAGTWKSDQS